MSDFMKKLGIVAALNILSFFIFSLPIFLSGDSIMGLIIAFCLAVLSLAIQLITGLVLVNNPNKKDWGRAMLLSAGIFTLIGFSMCQFS
jgi:hypothetical protein